MGLETHRLNGIIDNSKEKENKRLYGSSLLVNNPNILVGRDNVLAIVKGGQYQEEIEKQLFLINKDLCIVNWVAQTVELPLPACIVFKSCKIS